MSSSGSVDSSIEVLVDLPIFDTAVAFILGTECPTM